MAKSNGSDGGDDTATVEGRDAPLIDLNEASLKKLIARAKKRGYLTYDELNEALPQDQMSSDQLEDIMSALSEMGVNIVENEDASDDEKPAEEEAEDESPPMSEAGPPSRSTQEGDRRSYRRSGAHVSARDGRGRTAQPRGRDRHRQAHRGRPRHDDPGAVRKPDHFQRDHRVVRPRSTRATMQLREILDLDAMLSQGADARTGDRRRRRERRRRDQRTTAGPTFKEEEEPEEEPARARRTRKAPSAAPAARSRKRKRTIRSASRRWRSSSSRWRSRASRRSPSCITSSSKIQRDPRERDGMRHRFPARRRRHISSCARS